MALYFVKALDGEDIAADLGNHLKTKCDRIVPISVDEVSDNCQIDKTCVVAVIVTPLMLNSLKDVRDTGIKSILDIAEQKIFLYKGCAPNAAEEINRLLNKPPKSSFAVAEHLHLIDDDHYDTAELKLSKLVRIARKENIARPSARKFIVEPDTATEGSVDVKIILLQDNKSYKDIKVKLPTAVGNVTLKQLREGVWMLKIPELGPGEHNITVIGDRADLGSARLNIVTKLKTLTAMMPDVVRNSPVEFLSELLKLNEKNFDNDLVNFIKDGTESGTIFQCIDRILEKAGEEQTCLHFCAKHNLPNTCKCILDRRFRQEMRHAVDASGKTALDIAKDMGYQDLIRILKVDDIGALQTRTTFSPGGGAERAKPPDIKSFKREPHPYEEIIDQPVTFRKKRENPYHEPWDGKQLPDGTMPTKGIQRTRSTKL